MDSDINFDCDDDDLFNDNFDEYFKDLIISLLPENSENIKDITNFIDDITPSPNKSNFRKFDNNSDTVTDSEIFVPYKIDFKSFDLIDNELIKEFYLNDNIKELMDNYGVDKILTYENATEEFYEWAKKNINDEIELNERMEILDENFNNVENIKPTSSSPDIFMISDDDDEINENYELSISDDIQLRRNQIMKKIEELIKILLQNLVTDGKMELLIRDTTKWSNFEMQDGILSLSENASLRKVSTQNTKSKFRFTLIMYLLSEIYQLLIDRLTCTLRELYYNNPELYGKQENVNNALKDICCYLKVAPWELGILSSSKGLIAGSLQFILPNNNLIDCSELSQNGTIIPLDTINIELLYSKAEYVLIVEKDTVFEKLLRNNILRKIQIDIILITGKGYPDINTRIIIKKIWNKLHIPIYALVDADPFGIEIMFIYRYGSKGMAINGDYLTCPKIQWIGIHPSEIDILAIPSVPLTKEDNKKIIELLQRPYLQNDVRKELEIFQKINKKAEIEAVSSFSLNFLINDYIVNKVKTKLFI